MWRPQLEMNKERTSSQTPWERLTAPWMLIQGKVNSGESWELCPNIWRVVLWERGIGLIWCDFLLKERGPSFVESLWCTEAEHSLSHWMFVEQCQAKTWDPLGATHVWGWGCPAGRPLTPPPSPPLSPLLRGGLWLSTSLKSTASSHSIIAALWWWLLFYRRGIRDSEGKWPAQGHTEVWDLAELRFDPSLSGFKAHDFPLIPGALQSCKSSIPYKIFMETEVLP